MASTWPASANDQCHPILIEFDESFDFFVNFLIWLYIYLASAILLLMSIYHVTVAVSRRLWRFPSHPSKLLAFNAGTLALLGIAAKPPNDTRESTDEFSKLFGTVLLCSFIGACMPSIAPIGFTDMWSNIAGVALLVITVIVNIDLQLRSNIIHDIAFEHRMVIIFMGMLLLVLLTQALAAEAMISDTTAMASDQLAELRTDVMQRPGYKIDAVQMKPWTWDVLEHEGLIKLMMVFTSNPQNVVARSPSAAVVGALVISSLIMLLRATAKFWHRSVAQNFLILLSPGEYSAISLLQGPTIFVCAFICVKRWARVALHEGRPFLSLLLDTEPSYWRRKVRKLQHELRAGHRDRQLGFLEVLYYIADFLICFAIVPIHRLLVAIIRALHILSALLLQLLIWPFKLASPHVWWFSRRPSREMSATTLSSEFLWLESQGLICLEGEDISNVRRQFVNAAAIVVKKQRKRVHSAKANMTDLMMFLKAAMSKDSTLMKNSGIFLALDQRGAPHVDNLHVQHGYQYGWSLTLVSILGVLTKIEMETCERSEASEAALDAYRQAKEMVKVVDEQYTPIVCSKETYAAALDVVWSNLPKKKHRYPMQGENLCDSKDPGDVLKALLRPAEIHMRDFNEKKRNHSVVASWQQETVMFYTMHTLCKNLLRWWIDEHNCGAGRDGHAKAKMVIEYISVLMADILASCLSNLPIALSKCTTDAVRDSHTDVVEHGIFLVALGNQLWEKLEWPTPCAAPVQTFGQLCQWF